MAERLLNLEQIGGRLGISGQTVRRNISKLKSKGLQEVQINSRIRRYRESSLDNLIRRAAEREESLF